jgi:hypothetical protein
LICPISVSFIIHPSYFVRCISPVDIRGEKVYQKYVILRCYGGREWPLCHWEISVE